MSKLNKTYFKSKKFPGYQIHCERELSHGDPPPLGFSGLPTRTRYHNAFPEKCHHKSSEEWKESQAVSNVEKRIISAILLFEEFRWQMWLDPELADLDDEATHGLRMGMSRFKHFLLDIEESYGRMSRKKQKNLNVLQEKQIVKTWEMKRNRGNDYLNTEYSVHYNKY